VLLALGSLGPAAYVRGRFTEAEAALRRSVALAQAEQNPARLRFGLAVLTGMLVLEGRLREARGLVHQAEAVAQEFSDPLVPQLGVALAWEAGELPRVADDGLKVAALLSPVLRAWTLTLVVLATAELGDLGTARRYLDLSGEQLGGRRFWHLSNHHTWAAGRLALAEGDATRAVATLRATAAAQLDTGALPYAAPVLADLAEAAMLAGRADIAEQTATSATAVAELIDREYHWGLAALAAAAAALADDDHSRASGEAQAALHLLGGSGHRLLEARAEALLGRALIRTDRDQAIQRLGHAADLFAGCGARWRRRQTLIELQRLGKPGRRRAAATLGAESLTTREQEVVALAVEGLTAKAIGGTAPHRRAHGGNPPCPRLCQAGRALPLGARTLPAATLTS
jgi:DNA-binding NarL/FixJ family response regulator